MTPLFSSIRRCEGSGCHSWLLVLTVLSVALSPPPRPGDCAAGGRAEGEVPGCLRHRAGARRDAGCGEWDSPVHPYGDMSWEGTVPAPAPQQGTWAANVFPSTKLEWIFWYLLGSVPMLGRLPARALVCSAHPDLANPLRSALQREAGGGGSFSAPFAPTAPGSAASRWNSVPLGLHPAQTPSRWDSLPATA